MRLTRFLTPTARGLMEGLPADTVIERRWLVSPYKQDLKSFVDGCEKLLSFDIELVGFTPKEHQVIQYYIAALTAKFPALL